MLPISTTGRLILRMLSAQPDISQSVIVRQCDVSQPTVARLMQGFQREGMLIETGRQGEGPGKPSVNFALAPNYAFSFGIAMLGDALSLILMDFAGRVRGIRSTSMPSMARTTVLDRLVSFRDELLAEVPEAQHVIGAGLGISGFFVDGKLINPPKSLSDWALVDIEPILADALQLPVELENDATAAAIGESLFGMGRRSANFAYLHLTNGFGGGIIANGRPFRGHHGNAGEFGGVWALLNEGYPSLDALRDVLAGHGSRFDTVDEMSASIDVATPGVAQWIEQAAPSFSMLAGLLTCIIDPEFIVLGGRLPAPIANALMDRVHIPSPGVRWGRIPPQPRLALAQVRVQPVATGAAALPMQRLFFG